MVSTAERVPRHTAAEINRQIREQTLARLTWYAAHPEEIGLRLRQLDSEWDIERAIEANASTIAFFGVALGAAVNRRWLLLPALVTGFLFQHAIQGWCPPVPILRRMGFRTADEINQERFALKALRGDFDAATEDDNRLSAILRAVRLK
jgi:hypothetical protein